jgi:hypothetical protein
MAIYTFNNNKNLHFIKDLINSYETARDLPVVPSVELLNSPLLGSPLRIGGLGSPLRDSGLRSLALWEHDGRYWLQSEKKREAEIHQCQLSVLVAEDFPVAG